VQTSLEVTSKWVALGWEICDVDEPGCFGFDGFEEQFLLYGQGVRNHGFPLLSDCLAAKEVRKWEEDEDAFQEFRGVEDLVAG
jgi:hypothetical protein